MPPPTEYGGFGNEFAQDLDHAEYADYVGYGEFQSLRAFRRAGMFSRVLSCWDHLGFHFGYLEPHLGSQLAPAECAERLNSPYPTKSAYPA